MRRTTAILLAAACAALVLPDVLRACSVPVFRYAIERWPADPYRMFVFHDDPLSEAEEALLNRFADLADPEFSTVNVVIQRVPLEDDQTRDELQAAVGGLVDAPLDQLPLVVIHGPETAAVRAPLWAGSLEQDQLQGLFDSPVRRQIAQRLVEGESAVWIFLDSGEAAKDDAAAALLESQLDRLADELELPQQLPAGPSEPGAEDDVTTSAELRVAFSVVRVARDDAGEAALVSMLMATEEDLHEFDEPMAFPVFGRGRALYALVGAGINEATIREACEFLIGPCSCQVKEQNPGSDLLMAVDWDGLVDSTIDHDRELPPLTGFDKFVEAEAAGEPGGAAADEAPSLDDLVDAMQSRPQPVEHGSAGRPVAGLLGRNLLIATLLLVAIVAGSTLMLIMRRT